MKKIEKTFAVILSGAILANTFMPTIVLAETHKLTFTVGEGTHTMETHNTNELVIDGTYVSFNPSNVSVSCNEPKTECYVEGSDNISLSYGDEKKFSLFTGTNQVNFGTVFSSDTSIQIKKYVENNNPNPQPQAHGVEITFDNATVNGNVVSFNFDNKNVVMTVTGLDTNNQIDAINKRLTLSASEVNNVRFAFSTGFESNNMEAVLNGADNYSQVLLTNGDNEVTLMGLNLPNNFNFGLQPRGGEHHDEEFENPNFDGKAYFVWKCGNNVCYHKFTNLQGGYIENNIRNYHINYIRESELTDESGNGVNYSFASYKNTNDKPSNWVLAKDVEDEQGNLISNKMTPDYIFGNGISDMGIQLDPTGAFSGDNSEATNGDRNFRAVIYSDEYQAVEFDNDYSKYTYYPAFWDPVFHSNVFDVTNTNPNGGIIYETYLLESNLILRTGEHSKSKFVSVKPLNVNTKAVTVTKDGDEFKIKFNSNYYDNVIFELTDEDGKDYYIEVHRIVATARDNAGYNKPSTKIDFELLYPSTDRYSDYEVIATVEYGNGELETKVVNPIARSVDNESGDVLENEEIQYNAGKNLSGTIYEIDDNENIKNVYYNVVKKGALDKDKFGGAFSGSGRGFTYESRNYRGE